MTPRFFKSFILVNIFKILTNLFLTFSRCFRKTSAIAAATLPGPEAVIDQLLKVIANQDSYGSLHLSIVLYAPEA